MGLVGAAALGHGVRLDGGLRQLVAAGAGGADGAAGGSASQQRVVDTGAGGGQNPLSANLDVAASALLPSMVASSDDFFPTVALTALLAILRDDALALHHGPALQAVTAVLRGLGGVRCLPFLSRVIPAFLHVIRASAGSGAAARGGGPLGGPSASASLGGASTGAALGGVGGQASAGGLGRGANLAAQNYAPSAAGDDGSAAGGDAGSGARAGFESGLREAVLFQIAALVSLAKHHIRPWLPGIFSLIQDLWPAQLPALLRVVEATAAALGEESRPFIVSLVPYLLSALAHDGTRTLASAGSSSMYAMTAGGAGPAALGPGGLARDIHHLGSGGDGSSWDSGSRRGPYFAQPSSLGAISAARVNTRHVLHTIAVLVCAGRRALWSGSRHLLDDHLPLFVPAIARLIDAGVGWAPASSLASGTAAMVPGGALPAGVAGASALAGAETGREDPLGGPAGGQGSSGLWTSVNGVPSNSSSLGPYGFVHFATRKQAVDTISALAASGVALAMYASRIIPALARTLADASSSSGAMELKRAAVDCLCLLLLQMREDYVIWVPVVRRAAQLATAAAAAAAAQGGNSDGPGAGGAVGGVGGPSNHAALLAADAGGIAGGPGGGSIAPNAFSSGGVSGTGTAAAVRHEAYERLVLLLLGLGAGYGYLGDEALALYGYGSPLPLPGNPVDLASLLYDPGGAAADGSGVRLAAALAIGPDGGPYSSGSAAATANTDAAAQIVHPAFSGLLGAVGVDADTFSLPASAASASAAVDSALIRLEVRPEVLKRAWETTAKSTKEDWTEWMRRLAVELLRESPSPALRSCSALAQVCQHPVEVLPASVA